LHLFILSDVFFSASRPIKVVLVDELGMTDPEMAQVARACVWVRVTAGFLPHLRTFVAARLACRNRRLAEKVAGLTDRQIFLLWLRLKEAQSSPRLRADQPRTHAFENARKQSR